MLPPMKKFVLSLMVSMLALLLNAQEAKVVSAVFNYKNKTTDVRQIPLTQNKDGSWRLQIDKENIPETVDYIDISADFSKAIKGDKGYIIYPRNELIKFEADEGRIVSSVCMPVWGMKSQQGVYAAIVKGLKHEFTIITEVSNGCYNVFPRFLISKMGVPAYENLRIDYYFLEPEATYVDMAKIYRKYQLGRKAVKPMKERLKKQPKLEYLAKTIQVRLQAHAAKPWPSPVEDQTPENEPKVKANPNLTYEKSKIFVQLLKNAGVEYADICTCGWNSGGHDGRYPQVLPVETACGTEAEFRDFIEHTKALGYQIAPHINYTDAYKVADIWSDDLICRDPSGKMTRNAVWCGGRAYNLCAKSSWEKFIPAQLEEISKYGFNGALYIDVLSAINPYQCNAKGHEATHKEQAKYYNKILSRCKKIWGLAASECGFDAVARNIDYCNYVTSSIRDMQNGKTNKLVSAVVPFWQIVYHGIVMSNPDRITQGRLTPYSRLKLVEFGGRPVFYTGGSLGAVESIAQSYNTYKPLAYLQWEFMEDHREIAPGIIETSYSNGDKTVCNYTKNEYDYQGKKVPPMDYILVKNK